MGLRLGQAGAGLAQRGAIGRTVEQRDRLVKQSRLIQIPLAQPAARAALGKPAGIGCLMIVSCVGPGHGDRRDLKRDQLAQRRPARSRDRHVRRAHPQADVGRVTDDDAVGIASVLLESGGVSSGDDRELGMPSLQLRPSLQQRVVDGSGTIGTAHSENERPFRVDSQLGFGILRRAVARPPNAVAQRHAHHRHAGRVQTVGSVGEAQEDAIDARRQQPRHQARSNVLFVNDGWNAQKRCAQNRRKRRVSACSDDNARTEAAQDRQGLAEAEDVHPQRRYGGQ